MRRGADVRCESTSIGQKQRVAESLEMLREGGRAYLISWTPQARSDLGEISDCLSERSEEAARKVGTAIKKACEALPTFPQKGSRCDRLGAGTRRVGLNLVFLNAAARTLVAKDEAEIVVDVDLVVRLAEDEVADFVPDCEALPLDGVMRCRPVGLKLTLSDAFRTRPSWAMDFHEGSHPYHHAGGRRS